MSEGRETMNEELIADMRRYADYYRDNLQVALADVLMRGADALEQKPVLSADNREALIALNLATETYIASDGYRATRVLSNEDAADRVLAAFTLPVTPEPTEVTTVAELDELPDRSVVMAEDDIFHYRDGLWCSYESARFGSEWLFKHCSPLKVLWVPVSPTEKSE